MSISNVEDKNIMCDLCFLNIHNEPMVQCVDCKIDICLYCFHDRLETETHKKDHIYRIIVYSHLDIQEWTILEEIIFFNSLTKYGIGNWEFIQKSVNTKDIREVEEFFYHVFGIRKNMISDKEVTEKTSNPFRSRVSIYMNNREDFDIEYLNEYESRIKDIEFIDSDDEVEVMGKKAILQAYENLLEIRKYRKEMIINKQIIDIDKTLEEDKRYKKYLEIDKYKFLLQFLTLEQYYTFLDGLCKEEMLKDMCTEGDTNYEIVLSDTEKKFCNKSNIKYANFARNKKKYIEIILAEGNPEDELVYSDISPEVIRFLRTQNYL